MKKRQLKWVEAVMNQYSDPMLRNGENNTAARFMKCTVINHLLSLKFLSLYFTAAGVQVIMCLATFYSNLHISIVVDFSSEGTTMF